MNELVSVILPTLANKSTLVHAIESVAFQHYQNIELVIVNDSGKDFNSFDGARYCLGVVDSNCKSFKVINTDGHIGAGLSRNLGMSSSTGSYLMFLDDDDILPPNSVEEAMTYVGSGYNGVFGATSYHDGRNGTITGYDCLFKDLDRLIILGAPCLGVLFKKSDVKNLDLSFTKDKFGEDYLFTMCYFLMNPGARYRITEKVLYNGFVYRHHLMDKTWDERCSKMYLKYYELYKELANSGYLDIAQYVAECVIGISITDGYMNRLANNSSEVFCKLVEASKVRYKPWFGWARELFEKDLSEDVIPLIRQTPVRYQALSNEIHKVR